MCLTRRRECYAVLEKKLFKYYLVKILVLDAYIGLISMRFVIFIVSYLI